MNRSRPPRAQIIDPVTGRAWVDRADLDDDQHDSLRDLYDAQCHEVDNLTNTPQAEWIHANFVAETGLVISLKNVLAILLQMRKKGGILAYKGRAKSQDGTDSDLFGDPREGDS